MFMVGYCALECSVPRSQKTLELTFKLLGCQMDAGNKLAFSGRAESALNHRAVSLTPIPGLLETGSLTGAGAQRQSETSRPARPCDPPFSIAQC